MYQHSNKQNARKFPNAIKSICVRKWNTDGDCPFAKRNENHEKLSE